MASIEAIESAYETFVDEFDRVYKETLPLVAIDGVLLKEALTNQVTLQLKWELLTKRINRIFDAAELEAETAYSEAISKELRDSYKSVSISEAREYAKSDEAYKSFRRLMIEIRQVRDESRGILETINSRKYILNNITNAVVASVTNHII